MNEDKVWLFYAHHIRKCFNLTPKQAETAVWALRGRENNAIANSMNISPETVNKHLDAVYKKAQVTSRSHLAALVLEDVAKMLQ